MTGHRRLWLALLLGLAMLAWLGWPEDAAAPGGEAAAAAVGGDVARPAATGTGTANEEPAATDAPEARREFRTSLRVHGRLTGRIEGRKVGLGGVAMWLMPEDNDRQLRDLFRTASDGSFGIEVAGPRQQVRLLRADAAEQSLAFRRDAASAMADWDLGDIEDAGRSIRVTLAIDCDPEVVDAMLACHQTAVQAIVSDHTPQQLGNCRFDLRQARNDPAAREHTLRCEAFAPDPSAMLSVQWRVLGSRAADPDPACLVRQELQPGNAAGCMAVLPLQPANVVRGRLLWADASARGNDLVQFRKEPGDSYEHATVVTADDGAFCFLVGDSPGSVGVPDQVGEQVSPGNCIDLRTGDQPIRFRLLGPDLRPIEDLAVACQGWIERKPDGHQQLVQVHPARSSKSGTAALPLEELQRRPWLVFDLGDRQAHMVAVPVEWLASPAVLHDVHTGEFRATGSLRILADDGGEAGAVPSGMMLTLTPKDGEGDLGFRVDAPDRLPWLVDGVLAGSYAYDLRLASGRGMHASGEVKVGGGETRELRLLPR